MSPYSRTPTDKAGFVGRELALLLMHLYPKLKLITTDIVMPPTLGVEDTQRLKPVKADLGNVEEVKGLFKGEKIGGVFALQ